MTRELTTRLDRNEHVQSRPGPTLLLIENEPLVRMVVAEGLQDLGFQVEEAESVASGFGILRALKHGVSAVIVDIGLGDGRGDDFAETLCASHPGLPTVIATGYSEAGVRRRFAAHSQVDVVSKPYDAICLGHVLQKLGLSANRSRT